ncbi:hypothetical protein IFR05_002359 [Cadophora sp. M221]|nr:hypothetical protein IFR05_002359 [Cadophora sp. M221]
MEKALRFNANDEEHHALNFISEHLSNGFGATTPGTGTDENEGKILNEDKRYQTRWRQMRQRNDEVDVRSASNIPLYANDDDMLFSFNKRWIFDSVNLLREGYYKVRESTHTCSLHDGPVGPEMLDYVDVVISSDLNRNLDWTPVIAYGTSLRLICRISGRISEWTRNVFLSAVKLKMLPAFLRPIGNYFIPEIKKCRCQNIRARELLQPIIQEREQEELLSGYEKPKDAIEWLRDVVPEEEKNNYTFFGIGQLVIGALSIHIVSHLKTNVILNLAAYPEYVPVLREEYEDISKECGKDFTLESMAKLKRLDSFLNETLRCPSLPVSFQRKALRPVALCDGTVVPAGTLIFTPANAISMNNAIFPDGDTFDGLRFYNLRESSPKAKNKYQPTSISRTQLHFGAGRHACPGRWYASAEIKLIIISLLSRYDIKLKEGESRPESIKFQHRNAPDPKAQVLIRERRL